MATIRWRPQVLWLPMGGLLGAFSGAVVGILALLVATVVRWWTGTGDFPWGEVAFSFVAGAWFGGMVGLAAGLVVGLELVFLVGSHLPREVARGRAYVLGLVLTPLTMAAPFIVDGGALRSLGDLRLDGETAFVVLLLAGGSAMGGPLARWVAGLTARDRPVS
jgi:hypothetical protein